MKCKLLFLILILSVSLVSAGQTFKIDLEKNPAYLINLQKGDRVEFELNNSLHTVVVENINENKAALATFTFVDTTNNHPFYSDINNGKFIKLDLNKDNNPDLFIIYNSSNKTTATLRFQLPVLKDKEIIIQPESNFKQTNYLLYFIYLFIPVVILILVLMYINFRIKSKEKTEEQKTENKTDK